jgi:ribokinase
MPRRAVATASTQAPSIVVLGSLNVDLVLALQRLPRPGETIVGDRMLVNPGGKGANQAVAAAHLGGRVRMVGRVGADDHGRMLIEALRRSGVDASVVSIEPAAATGTAVILVDAAGENMIAVAPGANAEVDAADAEQAVAGMAGDDVLVLQLEIPIEAAAAALKHARAKSARVILNAAPAQALDAELIRGLEGLVLNESEAAVVLERQASRPGAAAEAAMDAVGRGVKLAVVTLGGRGAVYATARGAHHVEPFQVTPVDTVAAGDAFVGALAVCLANGLAAEAAVRLASAAGAAATTRAGAQSSLPEPADLLRLFGIDWGREAQLHSP